MRRAIARAMLQSQSQSAAATLVISVDATNLTKVHKEFKNASQKGGPRISINDLIILATSRVLPKYSQTINAHVFDDRAIAHRHATSRSRWYAGGLIVPVLKNANSKSLREISEQARQMIKLVREGQYRAVDLKSERSQFLMSAPWGLSLSLRFLTTVKRQF
ncbi:2-oxo acid dehydrogenase subunit E2 [Mycoplasma sp. ATU-Cv-508]|uniref:2-oxo acid dehydrogenase subunit E2 n=1 Tax=Mycoplasma sp. ATU-Cv-508 TaxID=2048001 RepID=UPI000FDF5C65